MLGSSPLTENASNGGVVEGQKDLAKEEEKLSGVHDRLGET